MLKVAVKERLIAADAIYMTTAHKKIGLKARALVSVLAVLGGTMAFGSAASAAPTSWSVATSDPAPGAAATTHTFTWNGFQTTTAARCIAVKYSNNADGTGYPTGLSVGTGAPGGTYLSGSYTRDITNAGTTGQMVFNNASATPQTAGAKDITWSVATEPTTAAGQTVYVTVTAYDTAGTGSSGNCGGAALESVVAGYTTTPRTTVTAVVDGTLTFTVAPHSGTCNGIGQTGTPSSTTVDLGHLSTTATNFAAQDLSVTSNAGNGFNVYMKSTATTANQVFADSAGHYIADATGTFASPAAITPGTAAFGYTALGTGVALTPGTYAKVPTSSGNDSVLTGAAGVGSGTGCVGFGATSSATTPAGAYSAQIVYRAVPLY